MKLFRLHFYLFFLRMNLGRLQAKCSRRIKPISQPKLTTAQRSSPGPTQARFFTYPTTTNNHYSFTLSPCAPSKSKRIKSPSFSLFPLSSLSLAVAISKVSEEPKQDVSNKPWRPTYQAVLSTLFSFLTLRSLQAFFILKLSSLLHFTKIFQVSFSLSALIKKKVQRAVQCSSFSNRTGSF